jgi:hypothetical protein
MLAIKNHEHLQSLLGLLILESAKPFEMWFEEIGCILCISGFSKHYFISGFKETNKEEA